MVVNILRGMYAGVKGLAEKAVGYFYTKEDVNLNKVQDKNTENPPNKVTQKMVFSVYPTPMQSNTIKGIGYNGNGELERNVVSGVIFTKEVKKVFPEDKSYQDLYIEDFEERERQRQEREYEEDINKSAKAIACESIFNFRKRILDQEDNSHIVSGDILPLSDLYQRAVDCSVAILHRLFPNEIFSFRETGRYIITLEQHLAKRPFLSWDSEKIANTMLSNPSCDLAKYIKKHGMDKSFYLKGKVMPLCQDEMKYADISSRELEMHSLTDQVELSTAADYISMIYHWLKNVRLPIINNSRFK